VSSTLEWTEIAKRLALTVLAGTLIGLNRWERGRPAGLRTTILVCLAASLAMIEANVLIGTRGRPADSFAQMDVMRLPLGILSGMGFIGAGVILRREHGIVGVTTAATLWFVTVIGLCFGGGQTGIGVAALILGLIVLWCFRWIENRLPREHTGTLTLVLDPKSHLEDEIHSYLAGLEVRIVSWAVRASTLSEERTIRCAIRTASAKAAPFCHRFLSQLAKRTDILGVDWNDGSQRDT